MSKNMHILGVMSGSSLDGVDLAVIRFSHAGSNETPHFEWIETGHFPYPKKWVEHLKGIHELSIGEWMRLDVAYSQYIAGEIKKCLKSLGKVDAIGWHGHTSAHHPEQGWTLALGHGQTLATALNIPVISEFRRKDVALGGQGAPLAPIVDAHFFPNFDIAINLGGIANLTIFANENVALDVCGCNQILNQLAQKLNAKMDIDGRWAAEGAVQKEVLEHLNSWSYLTQPPPKSLGNHSVSEFYGAQLYGLDKNPKDLLSTAIEHITTAILQTIPDNKRQQILLSGGGARNKFLVQRLKEKGAVHQWTVASYPWLDYKEAFLMAYMAYRYQTNKNNVFSTWTGSAHNHRGGVRHNP